MREDLIALYGFLRPSEKLLFEKLITVSGIGPKLAITILSGMAADEMVGAIRGNDIARLTRIPGIGKKTAERMVLELRDKLPEAGPASTPAIPSLSATEEDVLSALVNLGYQRPAAEKALAVATKNGKSGSFDAMFRDSLAGLSKWGVFFSCYFPMQNVLKIKFRMSSVVVAPVIASSGRSAL